MSRRGSKSSSSPEPPGEPVLTVPREEAADRLQQQIDRGRELRVAAIGDEQSFSDVQSRFWNWQSYTVELLARIFSTRKFADEFSYTFGFSVIGGATPPLHERVDELHDDIGRYLRRITSIAERLELIPESSDADSSTIGVDPLHNIDNVTARFHRVVRELRSRHAERNTLDVKDEYDVQDLLRSLLTIFFNDIREEEGSSSNAGSSPRLDFLLKNEQIVIEAKMTRPSLTPKKLGEELIIDIQRYRGHPDCKTLYCFVYDPGGYIRNPNALATDLGGIRDGMRVVVRIEPQS